MRFRLLTTKNFFKHQTYVARILFLVFFIALAVAGVHFYLLAKNGGGTLSGFRLPNSTASFSEKDTASQAQAIINRCQLDTETCYPNAFGELAKKQKLPFTMATLQKAQALQPATQGCHLIAHKISLAEMEKAPDKWLSLLQSAPVDMCSGGFMHGVLEARSRYDSSFTLTAQTFPEICSNVSNESFGRLSCNHILGHILLAEQVNNIPGSVAVCNGITDFPYKYECLSGVFMENITRLNLIDHGLAQMMPWNLENTLKTEELCKQYTDLPAQACWKELSYMYWSVYDHDPQKLHTACKRSPNAATTEECFIYGVGNMVSSHLFKPDNLKVICDPYGVDKNIYARCIQQVVGAMSASTLSFMPRMVFTCQNAQDWFKESCFSFIGAQLNRRKLAAEEKQTYCKDVEEKYKHYCVSA